MSARITNFAGGIVAEKRGGARQAFRHDPLGSTIAVISDAGTTTATYNYWPYGEVRSSTGSATTPWKFCGRWGYYEGKDTTSYVRARVLKRDLARWMTVDPLWPEEWAYGYVGLSPATFVDPHGMWRIVPAQDCPKGTVVVHMEPWEREKYVDLWVSPDRSGVVAKPHPDSGNATLISAEEAIRMFSRGCEDCIAINGALCGSRVLPLRDDKGRVVVDEDGRPKLRPWIPGAESQPVGTFEDHTGRIYPGKHGTGDRVIPHPGNGGWPVQGIPVVTGAGCLQGTDLPTRNMGGGPKEKRARSAACIDSAGRLVGVIGIPSPPGATVGDTQKCGAASCPKGSKLVFLDGRTSTAIWIRPGGKDPKPVIGGRPSPATGSPRPVANWIVICGKQMG